MSQITDSPVGNILEEIELGGYGSFPDKLFLINVGGDRYACNNATLPDGQVVDGLATFPDADEATTYMGLLAGLSGDIVSKSFEDAREIAKSKPKLSCMFLFVAGRIVEVHYVK
jgi:hypothetical protein